MESKVNYVAVGLFVLTLSAALIAGVLWLASGGTLQKKYDFYRAIENESVSGLNINAPIKYQGVSVGKVTEIQLDHNNPEQVHLLFAIEHGTPIKTDTWAVLKAQGLTGIAYVELRGGTKDAPLLRAGSGYQYPVIPTKPSLGARLEDVLTTVLANLSQTSANINAVLDDKNREALRSTLSDLSALAHAVVARKDTLDQGITAAAKTLQNTAQATQQLGPVLQRIGRSADAIENMSTQIGHASTNADKTITSVGVDVTRLTDALPEFERLLSELRGLTGSLRRLIDQSNGSPASLLLGKQPVQPGPGE